MQTNRNHVHFETCFVAGLNWIRGAESLVLIFGIPAIVSLFVALTFPERGQASEVASSFTLDGRLFSDAAGNTPLVDGSVALRFRILNESKTCILYEEQQTVSTIPTNGYFSVQVGSAVGSGKRSANDSGHAMSVVYQNASDISGYSVSDLTPCTHTAASGAKRHLRVTVTASGIAGGERTLSPDLSMDSVPHALVAGRAETLGGVAADQFLRVNTSGSNQLTQANLESIFSSTSNVTELSSLIAGTNTNYVRSVANTGASIPSYAGDPSTPSVGSIWYDSVGQTIRLQTGGGAVSLATGGSSLPAAGGTAAAPGYAFSGDTNTGMFSSAADTVQFSTNSTERMRITSTGNVGIGTMSPSASLDITGASVASGTAPKALNVVGGNTNSGAIGTGGEITLTAGGRTGFSAGGVLNLAGGNENGGGGNAMLTGGSGGNGWAGGSVVLSGGITGAGINEPASISIGGGVFGANTNGRDVTILPGAKAGTGADGNVLIATTRGNVGIGTAAPLQLLHLRTSSANNSVLVDSTGNGASILLRANSMGTNSTARQWKLAANPSAKEFTIEDTSNARQPFKILGGTGNGDALVIAGNGNVGVGTDAPAARLDITDGSTATSALIVPRAGAFTGTPVDGMVRYNSTSNLFEFRENGSWVNFTPVSDERLKTAFQPIEKPMSLVNQLRPLYYEWDRDNPRTQSFAEGREIGFIAQEVEAVLPEVVNQGEDGFFSIEYAKISALVVAALQELFHDQVKVQSKVDELEGRLEQVTEENRALKNYLCAKGANAPFCLEQ